MAERRQPGDATRQLRAALSPARIADALAALALRYPVAMTIAAFVGLIAVLFGGFGFAAVMEIPLWVGLPLALVSVMFQVLFYVAWHDGHGLKRWIFFVYFLIITAWNVSAIAGGIVALNPDNMGRHQTRVALRPLLDATTRASDELNAFSGGLDAIERYSAGRAAVEGATGPSWRPTCPASTGPGPGPITQWRAETGQDAARMAAQARRAAATATAAARQARALADAYDADSHAAVMASVADQYGAVRNAIAQAGVAAALSRLRGLAEEVGATGRCPDPELRRLISAVTVGENGQPTDRWSALDRLPEFEAPRPPSEREAVFGLWRNVAAYWFGGPSDLSLYWAALLFAPLIDILLFTVLGNLVRPAQPSTFADQIARMLGVTDVSYADLKAAYANAGSTPEWTDLIGRARIIRRWRRAVVLVVVPLTEHHRLNYMRRLIMLKAAHDAGASRVNHRFLLRPGALNRLWDALVLQNMQRTTTDQPA